MVLFNAIFPSCNDYDLFIKILLEKHSGWIYSQNLYTQILSKTKDIKTVTLKLRTKNVYPLLFPRVFL